MKVKFIEFIGGLKKLKNFFLTTNNFSKELKLPKFNLKNVKYNLKILKKLIL